MKLVSLYSTIWSHVLQCCRLNVPCCTRTCTVSFAILSVRLVVLRAGGGGTPRCCGQILIIFGVACYIVVLKLLPTFQAPVAIPWCVMAAHPPPHTHTHARTFSCVAEDTYRNFATNVNQITNKLLEFILSRAALSLPLKDLCLNTAGWIELKPGDILQINWCSGWPCIVINSYNKTNQMD